MSTPPPGRASQTPLHEYYRPTGERIHHMNVTESGEEADRGEIVKGYEATKGHPIFLEQEELDAVKLPSSDTLELVHFVDRESVPLMHFERPYYVLPDGSSAQEIYAVLRDAMKESGKIGIGQITLRGREELCALLPFENGLMIETLRYTAELFEPKEFYSELKDVEASGDYVQLAQELIKKKSGKLNLKQFHDHYHEAMQEIDQGRRAKIALRIIK